MNDMICLHPPLKGALEVVHSLVLFLRAEALELCSLATIGTQEMNIKIFKPCPGLPKRAEDWRFLQSSVCILPSGGRPWMGECLF